MSASKIIITLWGAVDATKLSDEQLSCLGRNEGLSIDLAHVADVMKAVGCLVASDGESRGGAGNFQDADSVAQLLWCFSDAIKTNAQAAWVASQAQYERQRREQEKNRTGMHTAAQTAGG